MKRIIYRWVYGPGSGPSSRHYDVGFNEDGTLHNPNGYPEAEILPILHRVVEEARRQRSEAAKKAAKTRADRRSKLVYSVGPRNNCVICGKGLGDPQSIERGIGSDCWQFVLAIIAREAAKRTTAA
jgi:Family of unknown function (DUF6011)